jgi:hypothetical protein
MGPRSLYATISMLGIGMAVLCAAPVGPMRKATAAPRSATPAFERTLVLAAEAATRSAPGAASIPDFSGMWGNPFLTGGLEPPASGPGPVTNRSRRNGVSDIYQFVGDYTNPILKPPAAEAVKKFGEISLTGVTYPTPANQCWPEPLPFIFRNFGMQMLQQPHQVTILYSDNHEVRHVRLNEPHPAQVTPSWYGDSVGHYEGDTLVIDTIGIKFGPFAMVDVYGTPFTAALHVVERYRLIDQEAAKAAQDRGGIENQRAGGSWTADPNYKGKGLQLHLTVEDEGVFTKPWSATKTYRRPLATEWQEVVCAENPHEYYAGRDTEVPRADKPDF